LFTTRKFALDIEGEMTNKTSITLTWDTNGRIQHSITGYSLPSPRNDPQLWVFAPSAPLFVANQLGALKPSYGLILCSQIIDIAFHNKYFLTPINSALKSAQIDFLYLPNGLSLQFFPKHGFLYNSDSLEDGVRQLVSNYFYYVYNQFTGYHQLELKLLTYAIIDAYLGMLATAYKNNAIGPQLDRWDIDFSRWSAATIQSSSSYYCVPNEENAHQWEEKQKNLVNDLPDLIEKHKSLCIEMGII
jgi:hypothetical protein